MEKKSLVTKFLAVLSIVCGLIAVAGLTPASAVMNAGTLTISYSNGQFEISATTIAAAVGDTFTLQSTLQQTNVIAVNGTGSISDPTLQIQCGSGGPSFCNLPASQSIAFTVDSIGDFKIYRDNGPNQMVFDSGVGGDTLLFTVTIGAASPPVVFIPPTVTGSYDTNGGTCKLSGADVSGLKSFGPVFLVVLPSDCSRPSHRFLGWTGPSGPLTAGVGGAFIGTQSGFYVVNWEPTITVEAPPSVSHLANYLCGPCSAIVALWTASPTPGVTYEVVLSTVSGDGSASILQRILVDEARSAEALQSGVMFSNLTPGGTYVVDVYAIKDGVRSAKRASSPVTLSDQKTKSITIVCERTTVSGKPGVRCEGYATGLADGSTVVPFLRFPGETSYAAGSARPIVASDGTFEWSRKTGKKIYVYFTTDDGTVQSNRAIVGAL